MHTAYGPAPPGTSPIKYLALSSAAGDSAACFTGAAGVWG